MPVARRSAPRRRVFRTRAKYDYQVTTRRYKKLLPIMWPELELELEVLEKLEQECFSILDGLGIPDEDQQYYVGYTKRLWEIAVDFTDQTYESEKTSLRNEYILRDWDPAVLDQLENTAKKYAQEKKGVLPQVGQWPGVTVLGGNQAMAQFTGVVAEVGIPSGVASMVGTTSLGGSSLIAQFGGVTVVRGTVT